MPKLSLSKFKNKHFLSLMGNVVISMFGLLQFWLLYRSFSITDVGTWLFFLATLGILDSARNGFLGSAAVKFYAGAEIGRGADVLGSIWFLAIGATLVMIAVDAFACLFLPVISNYQVQMSLKWVGITILSSLPYTVIFWKLQAEERYGTILWMRLINSGSTISVFFILLYLDKFSLYNALLWNMLTNCLTSIVGLVANLGQLRSLTKRTKATILEIAHFGKYSMATTLSTYLLSSANTYIVTFMLGPGAAAILSVPSKLMEVVEITLRSFVGTGMTTMATAFNQKNMYHVSYILNKYAGMLTMAFIPLAIGVLFLADIPINILSSGKYMGTEAANLFRIIMFTSIIYPIDRFNGVALDIIHKPRINFIKVLIMLAVKIVGTVGCIALLHNIYGAPIGGLLTMLAGLAFGARQLSKYMDFSIPTILKTGFVETLALGKRVLGKG